MRRFWLIGLVSLLAFGVVGFSIAHSYFSRSQWGVPMMERENTNENTNWNMPMMGRGYGNWGMPMMGHGYGNWGMPMMGMMGRGWNNNWNMPMMDPAYCMGNRAYDGWYGTTAPTREQATTIVQDYIKSTRNPNLKVGKVTETDTDFEVEIVTKDDSLVDKIQLNKRTDRDQYGTTALTKEQAATIVQDYIKSTGNPNLKVGKVAETDTDFEVEILTRDDSLVDKIRVDKRTGLTRSIY